MHFCPSQIWADEITSIFFGIPDGFVIHNFMYINDISFYRAKIHSVNLLKANILKIYI